MAEQLGWELSGAPDKKRRAGPVYQGVCAQLRRLEALQVIESGKDARQAGLVAQARSLAGSIDRESGHWPDLRQASGVSLAALHERLAAILAALDPQEAAGASDAWGQLLDDLAAMPPLEAPPHA